MWGLRVEERPELERIPKTAKRVALLARAMLSRVPTAASLQASDYNSGLSRLIPPTKCRSAAETVATRANKAEIQHEVNRKNMDLRYRPCLAHCEPEHPSPKDSRQASTSVPGDSDAYQARTLGKPCSV